MKRVVRRLLLGLLAAAMVPACDVTAPIPPEPGVLTVRFGTPGNGDAAAVIDLTVPSGIQVTAVDPVSSALVVFHRAVGGRVRVAVFGDLVTGPLIRIAVPDVNAVDAYTAHVVEVSDADNALRSSLSGYTAAVIR